MKTPNFKEEKKLWKKGYKYVVGLDEAGRGPLSGPVVAGAVIVVPEHQSTKNMPGVRPSAKIKNFGVRDSKLLSAKQREEIYNYFKKNSGIEWGIGIVSEKIIDKINILEATKSAMNKAFQQVQSKLNRKIDYLIIDGSIKLDINVLQKSIIKADQKVFSCALASIFAKVTRDKIMEKEHKKYPEYGFNQHKGYGTTFHLKMLKKHGPCKIHRKSFRPIRISK